jgi:hypothetical protein
MMNCDSTAINANLKHLACLISLNWYCVLAYKSVILQLMKNVQLFSVKFNKTSLWNKQHCTKKDHGY